MVLYYYIGIYCKINKNNLKVSNYKSKDIILAGILLIICIIILNLYMYKLGINYTHITSQLKITSMIYILYAIIVILNLANKTTNVKCLVNLGDLSFGIYFIHTYFIKIYNHVVNINNYYIQLLLGIIIVTVCSYYSIIIFKKVTKGKLGRNVYIKWKRKYQELKVLQ